MSVCAALHYVHLDAIEQESIIADNAHASSGIVVLNHEVNDQVVNLFLQEFPHIRDAFQHVTPVSTCVSSSTSSSFSVLTLFAEQPH